MARCSTVFRAALPLLVGCTACSGDPPGGSPGGVSAGGAFDGGVTAAGAGGAPGGAGIGGERGATGPGGMPIKSIVVIVKENHSFDNYFTGFPGADTTTKATLAD